MGTFETPEGPPLVQATGLALALLRATKTATWAELVALDDDRLAKLTVDPEQLDLLNEHRDPIALLKASSPALTLAVCPVCSRFSVVASAAPATCNLKLGCTGKPVRVPAATKRKPPAKPGLAPVEHDPEQFDAAFGDPGPDDAPPRLDVHVHVHVD